MKCDYCSNNATVLITEIVKKVKHEVHLCDACARKKKLLNDQTPDVLQVPGLVNFLFGTSPSIAQPLAAAESCPDCGIDFHDFRTTGRFGCPNDYDYFRPLIFPLLEKIHNNAKQHIGKIPKRQQARLLHSKRAELKAQLVTAVREERYEDAAVIRDQLRAIEGHHDSE
ncbi:MAG: UvrB/UvrC motif-containing protein [Zavarzinella sp.]